MRFIFVITLCCGLGLGLFVLLTFGQSLSKSTASVPMQKPATATTQSASAVAKAEPKSEKPQARPVDAQRFAAPVETGETVLERLPARKPLSEPIVEKKPEAEPETRFQRVVAESSGVLVADTRSIVLADIAPFDRSKMCTDRSGREWPCGAMARTALRNFIRNRAVLCALPSDNVDPQVTARCSVADKDISTWLVEQGWADADESADLSALAKQAENAHVGQYGDDPRFAQAGQAEP